MPTIVDLLEEHLRTALERPEIREQLKPLLGFFEAFYGIGLAVGLVLKRVAELPPSSGYERWLVERGCNPISARGMAHLIVRRGTRCAKESPRVSSVIQAVRFLARPHRNKPARQRRVGCLLAAWRETSIIETVFQKAGFNEFEFIRSLESTAAGDEDAYRRVTEIAAELAPHLSVPRGPKISAASAAHEFFLESAVPLIKPSRYTWSYVEGDFLDSVTAATRREFNDNDFDPQSAVRRLKSRS